MTSLTWTNTTEHKVKTKINFIVQVLTFCSNKVQFDDVPVFIPLLVIWSTNNVYFGSLYLI